MTEQRVKKREWVKTAAIIFLAVMLVLTFFSNTIMNHSLPEVAAQYVQSGQISAKIRGTGTVTANESYEVKSEQTREVLSVPVKVGDQVSVGDTLLLFSDAESSQLQEAQDALDALVLAYQKALINSTDTDYAKENRDIQLAQAALDQAKAERDAITLVTAEQLASAKANATRAKNVVAEQQAKVDALSSQFSSLSPGTDNSTAISAKNSEISQAQAALDAAMLAHKTGYDNLNKCATAWRLPYAASEQKALSVYEDALAEKYTALLKLATFPAAKPDYIPAFPADVTYNENNVTEMVNAYNAINPKQDTLTSLKNELSQLYSSSGGDYNYYTVQKQLNDEKERLVSLQTVQTSFENDLADFQEKYDSRKTAQETVDTNQKNLENLMFSLAETKKADGKTQATEALDLAAQQKQIEEKREELEKLQKGGEGASVESKVNGVVASVNISAGKTAEANSALMTIEVPDMGYGLSISVTNEQSKKVKVGDTAEINSYYMSSDTTATLVGISSDPQNPGTNKMLNFKLEGDVESGAQLSIAIGERGGNYEAIVPNSAIRSDNNGKFVLAVVVKSSPLGNRFMAQRIDVQVLTSDDVNSAVSGGITTSDMVITTSTKPLESGMLVRLPD